MASFKQHVDRTHYKNGLPIGGKGSFAIGVAESIINHNSYFPTPPYPADDLRIAGMTLNEKQGAYLASGSRIDKAARDTALAHCMLLTDQMAGYVDSVANGNPDIIARSGFTATSATATPTPPPPAQGELRVDAAVAGRLSLTADKKGKVEAYAYIAAGEGMSVEITGELIKITNTANHAVAYVQIDTHDHTVMQGLAGGTYRLTAVPVNLAGAGPATPQQAITVQGGGE